MPTSPLDQIQPIMELILDIGPRKILDVGIGWGKYGALCREYLEQFGVNWDGSTRSRRIMIEGIEIYEKYHNPMWNCYDQVHIGNAYDLLRYGKVAGSYDLILLIDILEHFFTNHALFLVELCANLSDKILISTPKNSNPGSQKNMCGNPYEEHLTQLCIEDFKQWFPLEIQNHTRAWIFLINR